MTPALQQSAGILDHVGSILGEEQENIPNIAQMFYIQGKYAFRWQIGNSPTDIQSLLVCIRASQPKVRN